jgi:pSer/pThr/pTyr-binding forkhead associated (FHA) protein
LGSAPLVLIVQFKILSGKKAGAVFVARRFPVRIGRAAAADLRLEDNGVWEQHLQLDFDRASGFILTARADAPASINGQISQKAVLHNGDTIAIGSATMQFWLGETRQATLGLRETLTWVGIAGVTAAQIVIIYWLLR